MQKIVILIYKVFGKNLRVIEASVLQDKVLSVNQATCVMIGELASNFIIEHYNYPA